MATTPVWSAAQAGVLGNAGATAASAQSDQFLGTHSDTIVYQGNQVVRANGLCYGTADPVNFWANNFAAFDFDQPFTMSGTTIGRVTIPILPVGNGADLQVSLCSDSSGVPGTVLASTRIPASWISQVAGTAGAAGPATAVQLTATPGPLALPQFNSLILGAQTSTDWISPASSGAGAARFPSTMTSGNYFVQVGGQNGTTQVPNVYTIPWAGGGALGSAVPQPPLPQAVQFAGVAATGDTLVVAGGASISVAAFADVYTAGWNPATGTISAWSAQAPLPQANSGPSAVAYENTVYMVGGSDSSLNSVDTVYWGIVTNGQLQSWNLGPPLPVQLAGPIVGVIGGYLVVAGGLDITNTAVATTYFAQINPDSSLGPWLAGPPMPTAIFNVFGQIFAATPSGLLVFSGYTSYLFSSSVSAIQTLTAGMFGPAASWQQQVSASPGGSGLFATSPGSWQMFTISDFATSYVSAPLYAVPMISVPLPVSGLSNGATYHVTMQQVGGDLNNYLRGTAQQGALPGTPSFLFQVKGTPGWTSVGFGYGVQIGVFDQTATGLPWHTWEDNGARISTLAYATTPDQRLLGVLEATRTGLGLNSNQGFEAGTAPWTATNCTLVQSGTRSFAGLHSGQVTPSGAASSTNITSERLPCMPGQSITVSAQVWFTAAVTANFSLSVTWYTAAGSPISNSSTFVSVPAAAWTAVGGPYTAPATAYFFTLTPNLTGTPPASNVWWIDNAIGYGTYTGPQQSTVTALEYSGTTLTGATVLQ